MTKEELKLEALKYLENFQDCAKCKHRWGDCADELDEDCLINNCYSATPKEQDIYLAGAEHREKRLAELETQIEKMKCGGNCKFEYWKNTGGCYDQKCRFTGLDCTNCKDKWKGKWEND